MGAKLYKFHCTNDDQDYFMWAPEIAVVDHSVIISGNKYWESYGEYMAEFPQLTNIQYADPEASWFTTANYAQNYINLGLPNVFSVATGTTYKFVADNGNYFTVSQNYERKIYIALYTADNQRVTDMHTNLADAAISMFSWCAGSTAGDLANNPGVYAYAVNYDISYHSLVWNYSYNSGRPGTYLSWTYWSVSDNPNIGAVVFWDGITDIPITPPDTDPYANLPLDGEDEITGGGSGTVSIPGFPGLSATSTGIIGLFAPSASQMQALASFMWTDFGGQGTTTEAILSEIVEALKRSISNPLDYVVGLNIIPSQGLSIGASQTIQFGFVSSNVSMPALTSQYFTVDCGSITFDPLCGDTFLDYAPYSKFSIYLPYIGVKDLDANDCVGHTIGVVYHGDTVTGGVTAYVTKDQSVMYQYSGCCALNVPLSSDNWGSTIAGAVQIATSMVSGSLTAGAAGVGAAAAQGAANVAANPSLLAPQVQHSGAVSGGAGCMGVQYPFIIREAVRFHSTAGFNKIAGYPSFYKRKLQNVSGYTTVVDVHLDNMPATKPEIEEIIELLKGGVYL